MTPEELRLAFIKSRGLNIDSTPIVPTPVQSVLIQPDTLPPPVRTDVIPSPGGPATDLNAPPVRLNPYGPPRAPNSLPPDTSATAMPTTPPPVRPPQQFPAQADAVPYAPPGVSLTSTPAQAPAQGWEGSVGVTNPEAVKAFDKGQDYQKVIGGLEEMAKGMKPKAPPTNPFPAMAPEQPNQPNQMAMQLMAAIMAGKNRGLTLTGR